jgi:O-methyltransferase involved in polyketide biosynthesis
MTKITDPESGQIKIADRNFSSISPSAESLLLMKGHTNIPFARQTAELIKFPDKYSPEFDNRDVTFWARTLHFEKRYWSIDNLLIDIPVRNILELSSGFSFRGLETVKQKGFHYIDTDLPDIIEKKKGIIPALKDVDFNINGTLELLALNALDYEQFHSIVNRFPEGEIVILNEGLLMYLDEEEKKKLCGIICQILKERGGYWITADVYVKKSHEKLNLKLDNKTKDFFKQHSIEDNKFESFEDAEAFFSKMGFVIDKKANVKRTKLSSMKYFLKSISQKQLIDFRKNPEIQATWRLKIAHKLL